MNRRSGIKTPVHAIWDFMEREILQTWVHVSVCLPPWGNWDAALHPTGTDQADCKGGRRLADPLPGGSGASARGGTPHRTGLVCTSRRRPRTELQACPSACPGVCQEGRRWEWKGFTAGRTPRSGFGLLRGFGPYHGVLINAGLRWVLPLDGVISTWLFFLKRVTGVPELVSFRIN